MGQSPYTRPPPGCTAAGGNALHPICINTITHPPLDARAHRHFRRWATHPGVVVHRLVNRKSKTLPHIPNLPNPFFHPTALLSRYPLCPFEWLCWSTSNNAGVQGVFILTLHLMARAGINKYQNNMKKAYHRCVMASCPLERY